MPVRTYLNGFASSQLNALIQNVTISDVMAVHYHSTAISKHPGLSTISDALNDLAVIMDAAMSKVHTFINDEFDDNDVSDWKEFPTRPDQEFSNGAKALEVRERFCSRTEEGKSIWECFISTKESAMKACAEAITLVMERQFGMGAIHIAGNDPGNLPKPGGQREHGYEPTHPSMLTSSAVLERKELKKPKFSRELDLFDREVNVSNHCRMHSCSNYCLKTKMKAVPYDKEAHKDMDQSQVYTNRQNQQFINVPTPVECRMDFGRPLDPAVTKEKDVTRGKPRVDTPYLEVDDNGMLKYVARRNHPRLVASALQFPYCECSFLWHVLHSSCLIPIAIRERQRRFANFAYQPKGPEV